MFQKIATLLIIILAAILEVSFFPNLFPSGLSPEIVLSMIVFWTVQNGFEKTWPKAILAGFILDLFYFQPAGMNVAALVIISYGAGFLAKRFLVSQKNQGFITILLLVLVGTIANGLILSILLKIFSGLSGGKMDALTSNALDGRIFLKIIINIASFIVIYWPLFQLEKFLSFYDKKSMEGRFFR